MHFSGWFCSKNPPQKWPKMDILASFGGVLGLSLENFSTTSRPYLGFTRISTSHIWTSSPPPSGGTANPKAEAWNAGANFSKWHWSYLCQFMSHVFSCQWAFLRNFSLLLTLSPEDSQLECVKILNSTPPPWESWRDPLQWGDTWGSVRPVRGIRAWSNQDVQARL